VYVDTLLDLFCLQFSISEMEGKGAGSVTNLLGNIGLYTCNDEFRNLWEWDTEMEMVL
jgi:hypothetical protein